MIPSDLPCHCPLCPALAARREATDEVLVCGDCGAVHGPDEWHWPRTPTPPQREPARALVAPAGGTHAYRRAPTDDDAVVTVRRLLSELRPDPRGEPLGWGPDESPPTVSIATSAWWRTRVQTTRGPSAITAPRGAFERAAAISGGALAAGRIRAIGGTAGETLAWLQRYGTLDRGLAALHRAVGLALASPAVRERWRASRQAALDGPRVVGCRLVREACEAWWAPRDF